MRALVLVSAVVLSGCFNPDDIFPVKGTVSSVDPVEGHVVKLMRDNKQAGIGVCDGDHATDFKETTVAADGSFGFEVFRAQTQSLSNLGPFCFRVSTAFPSGSRAWSDVSAIVDVTTLSPLLDWRANPRIVNDVLKFDPPIPLPDEESILDGGNPATLEHRLVVTTADGGVLWQVDDHLPSLDGGQVPIRVPMPLDAFALEDFSGTAALQAHLFIPADNSLSTGPLGRSDSWPVELRAGQTLSLTGTRTSVLRGAPCGDIATPCPLTDGDLSSVNLTMKQGLTFDLPGPSTVSAVVLRSVETSLPLVVVVLTQQDGGVTTGEPSLLPFSSFDALSSGGPPVTPLDDGGFEFKSSTPVWASLPVDAGAGVIIKRVTLQFPGGITRAAEVSVFE